MDSLYDTIGGLAGLEFVAEGFCDRVRADRELSPMLGALDMPRLKSRLVAQLADATGGPVRWSPAALLIDDAEIAAVKRHLVPTLLDLGLDRELAETVAEWVLPGRTAAAA